LVFATKGAGSNDEIRILELVGDVPTIRYAFDRAAKARNVRRILRLARRERPSLIVMEGTGLAGGVSVLLARLLLGIPYVVSSGDAVGPFIGGAHPALRPAGWLYELLLCRHSAGFIGWTPYLVGRALTFGAPKGITAASFIQHTQLTRTREEVRAELGIPQDALVFGIVGSLDFNEHYGYCYGLELVEAIRRVRRRDVAVLVVGGGSGLERLRALASEELGRRVFLPGPVPPSDVSSYTAAIDVGSLPQSVDQVGSFRYTTKLSEYIGAGLPIATGRIPVAYDLAVSWSWRLPGRAPWDERYIDALARLIDELTVAELDEKRAAVPESLITFDRADQRARVGAFVSDLLDGAGQVGPSASSHVTASPSTRSVRC
jgi:hypothetical protein